MKKMATRIMVCFVISGTFWILSVVSDQIFLSRELIRMHVVAHSDSPFDQSIKLQVRDVLCASIEKDLENIQDVEMAMQYLQENLPKLQLLANQVLAQAGVDLQATVTLCKEAFPSRLYDTFRLPAGIYETLRVTIGEGDGKNWWCVAFPTLCLQATESEFQTAAVSAGFSETLTDTLTKTSDYEIRFYLMDTLGKIAGFFYRE